jgi:acetyl-CoA acetyltransferase
MSSRHTFHDVAICGIHNTRAARRLDGQDSRSITVEAALGALADAGLSLGQVDGVVGPLAGDITYQARLGPIWRSLAVLGIGAVFEAAWAIAAGFASTVVVAGGNAGVYVDRARAAPWTRPDNELVAPYGMFTAAEFALVARRHMDVFGTSEDALAHVAATIRNNGSVNPNAVYYGRGPFTADDILSSRMIADPFHLLDCAMAAEGGCAVVLTNADGAQDLPHDPVYILGGNIDHHGPWYQNPPLFDLGTRRGDDLVNGWVGRRAAREAFRRAGLRTDDVDVCELYDPFSFEIIRQLEAFGFCPEGEGGPFVMSGAIDPGGRFPVTTDGGTMSFCHPGGGIQIVQRVIRAVQQLRGECQSNQVNDAEIAIASGGGAGALYSEVMLLGRTRP